MYKGLTHRNEHKIFKMSLTGKVKNMLRQKN
jgi:hypothetical protein